MTFWTDERVDVFTRLASDGLSASQIAAELGATRSAVIGKSHRTGIKLKGFHGPQGHRQARSARKRVPSPPIAPSAPVRAVSRPACQPIDLLALTNETCRWVVSDEGEPFLFCGAHEADLANGAAYCFFHGRMAYRRAGEAA